MRETGCRDIGGHAHKSERFVLGLRSLVLLFCLAYYIVTSHFVYTYIYIIKSLLLLHFLGKRLWCVCHLALKVSRKWQADCRMYIEGIKSIPTQQGRVKYCHSSEQRLCQIGWVLEVLWGKAPPPPQWAGPLSGPWRRPGPCGWPPWHLPGWRSCPPWAAGTLGAGPRCARCSRSGNRWCPC